MIKLAYPKNIIRVTNVYQPKDNKHLGVDFGGVKIGDDTVWCIGDGEVIFVRRNNGNLGHTVRVYHKDVDMTSMYCHLKSISVNVGMSTNKNTVLGFEGDTGNADGAHLHFGLYKGKYSDYYENSVNPLDYLYAYNEQHYYYLNGDNDVREDQVLRNYTGKEIVNIGTCDKYKQTLIDIQETIEEVL